ncbi:hypothetical protein Tco_0850409 [Tanacetum coccineum]
MLPYTNIQEAETSLARSLTTLETLCYEDVSVVNRPLQRLIAHCGGLEYFVLGFHLFWGPAIDSGHMKEYFWLWIALRQIEAIEGIKWVNMIFHGTVTKYIPFYGGADYHDYHHYVGGKGQSNFASVFNCLRLLYGTDKGYSTRRAPAAGNMHLHLS